MRPVSSGKPPGVDGRDGGTAALSLGGCQASRLSSAAAAGCSGDLAARECAVIQQALQTRARADQCWEMYVLIDDSRHAAPGASARKPGLPADALTLFYGAAAARVRQHRRALQRLAHVRATKGTHAGAPSDAGRGQSPGVCAPPPRQGPCGDPVRVPGLNGRPCPLPRHKSRVSVSPFSTHRVPASHALRAQCGGVLCQGSEARSSAPCPVGVPRSPARLWPHRSLIEGR